MDDLSGQIIKGYELRECIGRGGFGLVERAYQPLSSAKWRSKLVRPEYANRPGFIRNFDAVDCISKLPAPVN